MSQIRAGQIDARFLERKAADDLHRARALAGAVGGLDAAAQGRHTVFVDSHRDVAGFKAELHFNTTKAMLRAPAQRGNMDQMAHIRVGHALDHVDDATLLRRFQRGDFDWDDDLVCVREAQAQQQQRKLKRAAEAAAATAAGKKGKRRDAPLQDTRSLRDSLFQKPDGDDSEDEDEKAGLLDADEIAHRRRVREAANTAPAVLLRMLRRAAVLEAQHAESERQRAVARSAKEVVERARRADKLQKLAAVVQKKTAGQQNKLHEKKLQKNRPGIRPRQK
jgi:hypothetical protein